METPSIAPTRDGIRTESIEPTTQTSVYTRVWLASRQPLQPFRLSRYLEMSSDFGKAGSTQLKFVLVHLRRTTSERWQANKGFRIAASCATKAAHTHGDSVLSTEGKMEIEKSRGTAKTEEGGERRLRKRKGKAA